MGKLGAHTIHQPGSGTTGAPLLASLLAWANTHGHERVAALGERYAHANLLNTTLVLPGPTGERNTLSFAPRGPVLCVAASVRALLNQLVAVLATGNSACMMASGADLLPAGLPPEVRRAIRLIDAIDNLGMDCHFALIQEPLAHTLRAVLAARSGALVTVLETRDEEAIPVWRLVAERALCVNTTAAGGNASLMTLGS